LLGIGTATNRTAASWKAATAAADGGAATSVTSETSCRVASARKRLKVTTSVPEAGGQGKRCFTTTIRAIVQPVKSANQRAASRPAGPAGSSANAARHQVNAAARSPSSLAMTPNSVLQRAASPGRSGSSS